MSKLKSKNDKNLESNYRFININYKQSKKYYSFLPTILIGQLMSYYLAKIMDARSNIFNKYRKSLLNGEDINKHLDLLKKSYVKGMFNIGISEKRITSLITNNKLKLSNKIEKLDELILQSRRTIDTIKHQAKTITVGAVREIDKKTKLNRPLTKP